MTEIKLGYSYRTLDKFLKFQLFYLSQARKYKKEKYIYMHVPKWFCISVVLYPISYDLDKRNGTITQHFWWFHKRVGGGSNSVAGNFKSLFSFHRRSSSSIVVVLESLKPQKVTTLERMRQNWCARQRGKIT